MHMMYAPRSARQYYEARQPACYLVVQHMHTNMYHEYVCACAHKRCLQ